MDVAKAIAGNIPVEIIGIRPGEKLHELMIPEDEARHTLDFDDHFIIQPNFGWWAKEEHLKGIGGTLCADGFSYESNTNDKWLTIEELKDTVEDFCKLNPEYK